MITKTKFRAFLKKKLSTDDIWAKKALLVVYRNQTATEQASQRTIHHNGVGFTGHDAEFLSSLAQQLERRNFLTFKQMKILKRQIHKYWKQIFEISDRKILTRWYYRENPSEQLALALPEGEQ